jgi:beta-lactamase class A
MNFPEDRRIKSMMKFRWVWASLLGLGLVVPSVKADTIASWSFDRDRNQLNFSTDEEVQPQVQLVSNPTRLVIDLPGITLGHPRSSHSIGSIIQEIRFGQFNRDTARIVVALAPGYTLDPNQVQVQGDSTTRWHVHLPDPYRSSESSLSSLNNIPILVPEAIAFPPGSKFAGLIDMGESMTDLRGQVRGLMRDYSFLETGMFFLDLQTGNYLDIGGDRVFPAASTIKLPILLAFFQDLDAGKVSLDETLVMRDDLITNGSGDMQDQPVGTRYTAIETVTKMITISDNTATNMIIDRLGGINALNRRFREWGLKDTVLHNLLSDLSGTNTTSSEDMVRMLAQLVDGDMLSPQSREQTLDILRHTTIRTLLPAGLGAGADIANKTGDIGFLIGDAGVITTPTGRRYLAGIFVERPYDDPRGRDFIRQVSQLVYRYLE